MAKMRGIKPETFTDSKVVQLSPLARYLFIGLWTLACDNGHVDDNIVEIKVRLLPFDTADVNALLEEMVTLEMVERSDGFITIPNLAKHQRIDRRWFKTCDHPDCEVPSKSDTNAEPQPEPTGDTSGPQRDHDGDTVGPRDELRGEERRGSEIEMSGAEEPTRRKPKRPLPSSWAPKQRHVERCKDNNLDLNFQARKFRNNAEAKDLRYVDWDRAFDNWLENAVKWAQERAPKQPTYDPWSEKIA